MISFKVQFEKLVKAYLQDKVRPWDPCACFVGNLLNNKPGWRSVRKLGLDGKPTTLTFFADKGRALIARESDSTYTDAEIELLEDTFMHRIMSRICRYDCVALTCNEEVLFSAFEETLLKLKEIHESKGEVVESYVFEKRNLQHELA